MRRPTARAYAASAAALAALLTPAQAARADGTDRAAAAAATVTEKVPYAMDSSNQAAWWTPVATYKGRGQYTYFAFNEPGATAATHRPAIARRDPDGVWSRLPLLGTNGQQAEFPDDNGHNQSSVARDGSGRLHVFSSMHANAWRYFRTEAPGGDVTDHAAELPDQGQAITYPVVTTAPNGDLYLAARVGAGSDQRPGKLYRWDNAAARWSVVATFAGALNRSVYPDDLAVDAAGRVHLLYEWAKAPATAFRHQLSYLRYDPSTGAFADSTGAAVTTPVTPATSDVIQDLTAGEEWSIDNTYPGPAVQSAKLALDGSAPKVAYRYRSADSGGDFRVYYASSSGGAWSRQTVYSAGQTTAALGITWDGADAGRVYYVTGSGTDRVFAATASGGTWSAQSAAPGISADRLAVRRDSDGHDVLYLPDTAHNALYYGLR
ncbi:MULTISPECIES: BNR-4 repeat-containing protein [unclassified Streptomyces]|uniref:BNR-4 repeat-containing protein n=1 Tax=unclassified Streptomyces TaxID=2593676 RepID=UPI00224DF76E|nr:MULTISPECIES: BNR-4 repeat-containing protein [unclassified Streptomyces]MCX5143495.1 BNR repeat-containing protein [Streptomyces sp. NBC_00338]WRZ67939.1 BNR repeat-containing protein [Streptomyces sp. NBC_01257]WSU61886.1 BNR repeat-containing protein [Streptomyces sp. NBC_01104]